jgi:hypothetical protein
MKFSRLVNKFERFVNKQALGKSIKPEKLDKLRQLLVDKKSRYETKLEATQDTGKRKKLETKLKVVDAQIEKSKKLSSS